MKTCLLQGQLPPSKCMHYVHYLEKISAKDKGRQIKSMVSDSGTTEKGGRRCGSLLPYILVKWSLFCERISPFSSSSQLPGEHLLLAPCKLLPVGVPSPLRGLMSHSQTLYVCRYICIHIYTHLCIYFNSSKLQKRLFPFHEFLPASL